MTIRKTAIAALVLPLALTACGGSPTPEAAEEVAFDAMTAMFAKDIDGVMDHIDPAEEVDRDGLQGCIYSAVGFYEGLAGGPIEVARAEVDDPEDFDEPVEDGDYFDVDVVLTSASVDEDEVEVEVIWSEAEGRWFINDSEVSC